MGGKNGHVDELGTKGNTTQFGHEVDPWIFVELSPRIATFSAKNVILNKDVKGALSRNEHSIPMTPNCKKN